LICEKNISESPKRDCCTSARLEKFIFFANVVARGICTPIRIASASFAFDQVFLQRHGIASGHGFGSQDFGRAASLIAGEG
jgi:hypothetical protein